MYRCSLRCNHYMAARFLIFRFSVSCLAFFLDFQGTDFQHHGRFFLLRVESGLPIPPVFPADIVFALIKNTKKNELLPLLKKSDINTKLPAGKAGFFCPVFPTGVFSSRVIYNRDRHDFQALFCLCCHGPVTAGFAAVSLFKKHTARKSNGISAVIIGRIRAFTYIRDQQPVGLHRSKCPVGKAAGRIRIGTAWPTYFRKRSRCVTWASSIASPSNSSSICAVVCRTIPHLNCFAFFLLSARVPQAGGHVQSLP